MNLLIYVDQLKAGNTVKFRPRGNSMTGRISSGQLVTLAPIVADTNVSTGDVVLCKVGGKVRLHLISARKGADHYQISNNHGHVNGWTTRKNLFGLLVSVEA